MKFIFKQPHLSIDKFDPVELPDFVVLTGLNGSGKSHLLEAINNKFVVIEGYSGPLGQDNTASSLRG